MANSTWTKKTDSSQPVVVYSNRPPKEISGGAVKVIADLPVTVWVGPEAGAIPDEIWDTMTEVEKHKLKENTITYGDRKFRVFTFPVPQSMYNAHYNMMSNGFIWPLLHSTDAVALDEPFRLNSAHHKPSYDYKYVQRTAKQTMMSIEVQPNGLGDKGTGLKTIIKERRQAGRPVMVVFAGDSPTGTDRGAFQAIRQRQLGLKNGDEAVSLQILRSDVAPLKTGEYEELHPDETYESPKQYSESLLRMATRLKKLTEGKLDEILPEDAVPAQDIAPNHRLVEDRIIEFAKKGGQIIFINDFDGTQSDIVPNAQDARMHPAALKAACTLIRLEKNALDTGKQPLANYALLTGRSRHTEGNNGVLDLINRTIDELKESKVYSHREADAAKKLLEQNLTGAFYHAMVYDRLEKTVEGTKIVSSGFDPKDQQFTKEANFIKRAREVVSGILNEEKFSIFNPAHGYLPLRIQENLGGIELNFRSVHIPTKQSGFIQKRFDELKQQIKAALEELEKDSKLNPEVVRNIDGHKTKMPAMRTAIESDLHIVTQKRNPEEDYALYRAFNELGNRAFEQLEQRGIITGKETRWIHDYQCLNVRGDIYTQHTPFPSLAFLQQITINSAPPEGAPKNSKPKPLLEYAFFQDIIRQIASHPTVSFQRPVDMKNFIEVAAAVDPQFKTVNRSLLDKQGVLKKLPEIGTSLEVRIFGSPVKIVNIPVGLNKDEVLRQAQESKIDRTMLNVTALDAMHIAYDKARVQSTVPRSSLNEKYHSLIAEEHPTVELLRERGIPFNTDKVQFRVPIRAVSDITKMLNHYQPHRIFLAAHRNDYSKSTMEKLIAAQQYLGAHPEEIGKTHFLFFLEPTRPDVPGYEIYRREVERVAKDARRRYRDSIVVIPDTLHFQDYMGLMRHSNTIGLLGIALKDGQDLTLREAASVRSDFEPEDPRAALAIITTNGTGAGDVIRGTPQHPGAFIIDSNNQPFQSIVKQLQNVYEEVVNLAKTREGNETLANRYRVASLGSQQYTPKRFESTILDAARSKTRAAS